MDLLVPHQENGPDSSGPFNMGGCRRSKQTLVNINYYYHQCFRSQKQELGYRQRCLLTAPCSLAGCPIPPQGTVHREITALPPVGTCPERSGETHGAETSWSRHHLGSSRSSRPRMRRHLWNCPTFKEKKNPQLENHAGRSQRILEWKPAVLFSGRLSPVL